MLETCVCGSVQFELNKIKQTPAEFHKRERFEKYGASTQLLELHFIVNRGAFAVVIDWGASCSRTIDGNADTLFWTVQLILPVEYVLHNAVKIAEMTVTGCNVLKPLMSNQNMPVYLICFNGCSGFHHS